MRKLLMRFINTMWKVVVDCVLDNYERNDFVKHGMTL